MLTQLCSLVEFDEVSAVWSGTCFIGLDGARQIFAGEALDIGSATDGDMLSSNVNVQPEELLGLLAKFKTKAFSEKNEIGFGFISCVVGNPAVIDVERDIYAGAIIIDLVKETWVVVAGNELLTFNELFASCLKPDASGVSLTIEGFFETPNLSDAADGSALTGRGAHVNYTGVWRDAL